MKKIAIVQIDFNKDSYRVNKDYNRIDGGQNTFGLGDATDIAGSLFGGNVVETTAKKLEEKNEAARKVKVREKELKDSFAESIKRILKETDLEVVILTGKERGYVKNTRVSKSRLQNEGRLNDRYEVKPYKRIKMDDVEITKSLCEKLGVDAIISFTGNLFVKNVETGFMGTASEDNLVLSGRIRVADKEGMIFEHFVRVDGDEKVQAGMEKKQSLFTKDAYKQVAENLRESLINQIIGYQEDAKLRAGIE